MKIDELKNKTILILGYGKEGQATERFLKAKVKSAKIIIADQKDGEDYLKKQKEADLAIKSPGIPSRLVTIPYTTATNIFFANTPNIKIGVTGSKGKSTTSTLIYEMLKAAGKKVQLVGNIGSPMLDLLKSKLDPHEIIVCELSSYQLEDIKYSPHIAIVTSLFPDHMNYHGDLESYYEAKFNIIKYAKPNDYFVYNPKFPDLTKWSQRVDCHMLPFKTEDNVPLFESSLIGQHNRDNIRGAYTVAKLFHVSDDIIQKALKKFEPLRHRLQKVGEFHGITFYDDAISTTPESTIAAINSLHTISTIFLGGENRGYDFTELIKRIKEVNIQNIVLFPDSGEEIYKLITQQHNNILHILKTRDMKEAVEFAYKYSPAGSICLLSTASPSYSVWKNFEEKGDLFQQFVKELANEKNTNA